MPLPSRDQIKDQMAADIAADVGLETIAQSRGYTIEHLRKLVRSDDMKKRIESARANIELHAQRLRTRILVHAPRCVDNIGRIADDSTHKDCFAANRFFVEHVTGAPDQTIQHNISFEVMEKIGYALDQIRKEAQFVEAVTIERSPNVLDGSKAIPDSANTAGYTPEAKSNGSSQDQ